MTPEERFDRIERQLEFTAQQTSRNSEQISQLGDFTLRLARVVDEIGRRFDELAESQKRTDERLNVLAGVVERYFSNGKK